MATKAKGQMGVRFMKKKPKATSAEAIPGPLKNRIIGYGQEDPSKLKANPENWRMHGAEQENAVAGLLDTVGWVQSIIKNKTTGHLIDGHMRVNLAIKRHEKKVPVVYVRLSPKEEKLVLALLDPISGLAKADELKLHSLLGQLDPGNLALETMIANLEGELGMDGGGDSGGNVETLLDQAVQLEPGKEYVLVMCEDEDEFAKLRQIFSLEMVRRGGYKAGSTFDHKGIERVIRAKRLIDIFNSKRKKIR
jgi:hypothetical protein